jgi:membrane protein insertase Oxa1/YidC/SpoIIIJ
MIRNKIGVIGGWTCAIRRKESALQRQIVLSHSALFTAPTTALGDGIASLLMAQQHLMIWLHTPLDGVVLPWWSSIVLGTLVLRTCITLPMAVAQHRSTAHLIQLRPALTAWSNAIAKQVGQEAREKHWTFEHYQKEVKRRVSHHLGCIYTS